MIMHVTLFAVVSLAASLIYHALREDDLKVALMTGLRRFGSFLVIAVLFGIGLHFFTRWL